MKSLCTNPRFKKEAQRQFGNGLLRFLSYNITTPITSSASPKTVRKFNGFKPKLSYYLHI